MNRAVLGGNDPIDQVSNGHDSGNFRAAEHGKMPDSMRRHEPHAFFHRVVGGNCNNITGENLFYGGSFRHFAFESNFSCVIALGQNAHKFVLRGDEQRADIFIGHNRDGLKNRGLGRHTPNRRVFLVQYFTNSPR